MSDVNSMVIEPLSKFYKDSSYLVKKCTKPDHKGTAFVVSSSIFINTFSHYFSFFPISFFRTEFARIARATGIGFLIMGFVGFFVKIIHIPINNILMGGSV